MGLVVAFVLDAVLVMVFAAFGRGAHSEGTAVSQVWDTAWPFLVGLVVGWAVLLMTRRNPSAVASGAVLWAATLVVGMVIRGLGDGRVPHWSFIMVAGIAIAVFLVGWRAVRAVVLRRRSASRR